MILTDVIHSIDVIQDMILTFTRQKQQTETTSKEAIGWTPWVMLIPVVCNFQL